MNKYLLIIFLIIFSTRLLGETITIDDLVITKGIYYKKFSIEPFNGEVTGIETGKFKNGIKQGRWLLLYNNGRLKKLVDYMDGIFDGDYELYRRNGNLIEKGGYKNGLQDGLWKFYSIEEILNKTKLIKMGNDMVYFRILKTNR